MPKQALVQLLHGQMNLDIMKKHKINLRLKSQQSLQKTKPTSGNSQYYLITFNQRYPAHFEVWFPGGENIQHTDITTYRLNWPRDQSNES